MKYRIKKKTIWSTAFQEYRDYFFIDYKFLGLFWMYETGWITSLDNTEKYIENLAKKNTVIKEITI